MKKKGLLIFGIVVVIAVAAFLGFRAQAKKSRYTEETAALRDLTTYYSYDGNINATDSQSVLSKSTMSVKTFFVKEGDTVQAGDPLFVLDNTTLQNSVDAAAATLEMARINYNSATGASRDTQLAQAQAALDNAQLNLNNAQMAYDRTAPLVEAGAASQSQLDQAKAALDAAQLNLNSARTTLANLTRTLDNAAATAAEQVKQAEAQKANLEQQLEESTVKAEISGEVTEVYVTENESVTLGTPILDIINYDTLEVEVKVDEYDLKAVQVGKEAIIDVLALDRQVTGRVTKIAQDATVIAGVSYFPTTITLDEGQDLRMGMSVEVRIPGDSAENALSISQKALQTNTDGSAYVLVPGSKNTPENRPVTTGISNGGYVQILTGLSEGDTVLIPATVTDMTSSSFTPVEK